MPAHFHIKGSKVAVYNSASSTGDASIVAAPTSNLAAIKFHSDLNYPKILSVTTGSITLPAMAANTKRLVTHTLFAHGQSGQPWVMGTITIGGVVVSLAGTVPVQISESAPSAGFSGFPRMIALGADATNVLLHEYAIQSVFGAYIVAITIPWKVFVTDVLP